MKPETVILPVRQKQFVEVAPGALVDIEDIAMVKFEIENKKIKSLHIHIRGFISNDGQPIWQKIDESLQDEVGQICQLMRIKISAQPPILQATGPLLQ